MSYIFYLIPFDAFDNFIEFDVFNFFKHLKEMDLKERNDWWIYASF